MRNNWYLRQFLTLSLLGPATVGLLSACGDARNTAPEKPARPGPALDTFVAHRQAAGAPSFTWLAGKLATPRAQNPRDAAWLTLQTLARSQGMPQKAVAATQLRVVHEHLPGAVIAQFEQRVSGIEVFHSGLNVAMTREPDATLRPVAATGTLAHVVHPRSSDFGASPATAIVTAYGDKTGRPIDATLISLDQAGEGGYTAFTVPAGGDVGPTSGRVKKVWFSQPRGLQPSYYVELQVGQQGSTDAEAFAYVVGVKDGVLFRHNQTAADAYSYRVWADKDGTFTPWDNPTGNDYTPHPTGMRDGKMPPYLKPNLVTLESSPFSKSMTDPWLPADATELQGNNVWAYADLTPPDGFNMGDIAVSPTGPKTFDRTFDPTTMPQASPDSRMAIITNLFYTMNYMHDSFYDAGYDEKSGNAQKDNYGRGGVAGDPLKAEAQDYSGRDNANASTQADGASPRIQMYLWDNGEIHLKVTAPMALAGEYDTGTATFGPTMFSLSGESIIVDDGTGGMGDSTDGCETPFVNAAQVMGKIAVIARGNCPFVQKAQNAQQNGAVGAIITNNAPGGAPGMSGMGSVSIPVLSMTQADGTAARGLLKAGTVVTFEMARVTNPDHDGSLDATIMSHEWGHTLSNRLIGNASGLTGLQAGGMGEGWSDFVALVTITRPEDASVPANKDWMGVYPEGAYAIGGKDAYYDGLRRYPYSADLTKNPLTFKHIQEGEPLPMTPLPTFGQSGQGNSEVHSTGEVWASMLFECYTALLRDGRYTFAEAQALMRKYLVAGLKMTPVNPTILEARDALLAAILAQNTKDTKDFSLCWDGFAKRGAGVGAMGPPATTMDNKGVTESFATGTDIAYVSATVDDSVQTCDKDGVLDNNEVGQLSITIRSVGTRPLMAATVTVTSDRPEISFPKGNVAKFGKVDLYQNGTAQLQIAMKGAPKDVLKFNLSFAFADPDLAVKPGPINAVQPLSGNYDEIPESSTEDKVEGKSTAWSVAGDTMNQLDGTVTWQRLLDDMGPRWHIGENAAASDQYLISPALKVPAGAKFGFTFHHRYSFEFDPMTKANFDGGVLEISTDDGQTWTDIGPGITMGGYTGKIDDNMSANPLAGRQAFTGTLAGYPKWSTATVDLGDAYAGKTVKVRFRVGTDDGNAGMGVFGWEIDDVAFSGISNKPFATVVADRGMCVNRPPVANAGPDQTVAPGAMVTLQGSGTDPDNDPLTYRWTQGGGSMVMLSASTLAQPVFTAPSVTEATVLSFTLVVNDGKVDSQPASVNITVDPALSPMPPPPQKGCACRAAGSGNSSVPMGGLLLLGGLCAALLRRRRSS